MPPKKKKKKPQSVEQLQFDIEGRPDTLGSIAAATGIGETSLALKIDSTLGERVWSGAQFEDRVGYLTNQISQDVITDVERSLMAQENYEDFIQRMFKNMGIDDTSDAQPSARMRDIENQLKAEGKVAWNEAMVAANQDKGDVALVWRSVLQPSTTPGCAARHGKLIQEDLGGETPGLHWGCKCDLLTIPNPNSENEETARQGQKIIDEMMEERAAFGVNDSDMLEESENPSRLFQFMRFKEADAEDGRWVTINGAHIFIKGTPPDHAGQDGSVAAKSDSKLKGKNTDTPEFRAWFGDSKVVDDKGEPLVVYHGTAKDIDTFDLDKSGTGAGALFGRGVYLATDERIANRFGKSVMPLYVSIEHPLDFDKMYTTQEHVRWKSLLDQDQSIKLDKEIGRFTKRNIPLTNDRAWDALRNTVGQDKLNDILAGLGYDGIVHDAGDRQGTPSSFLPRPKQYGRVWVAFSPTQIKSATRNKGTFNPHKPSIIESYKPSRLFQFREAVACATS